MPSSAALIAAVMSSVTNVAFSNDSVFCNASSFRYLAIDAYCPSLVLLARALVDRLGVALGDALHRAAVVLRSPLERRQPRLADIVGIVELVVRLGPVLLGDLVVLHRHLSFSSFRAQSPITMYVR